MRIVVLSCNTGEGHNAAGRAVVEWALEMGHQAEMVDLMLLAGKRVSRMVGGSYVGMVKHMPGLFHFLYRLGGKVSSCRHRSPVYYANRLLAKSLLRYLSEHPVDVIVTPHLFPAETLTYLKEKGKISLPVLAISTDYTCIPFWEETNCDAYILPHPDLMGEYERRGVPAQKLYPLGIPVRPEFTHEIDRAQAREQCGLSKEGKAYLVMGGSMGFGKIHLFVAELLRQREKGDSVVIVCGSNRRLENTLNRLFSSYENVKVLGFTHEVAMYMAACDVVFTKPGGLTSTEAAVRGIPMVHTRPIPGCETANQQFFGERGMSCPGNKIQEQIAAGKRLLQVENSEKMKAAQRANIDPQAAVQLLHLAETMLEERKGEK